jgi:DNA-binding transcriptional LysR family regulator
VNNVERASGVQVRHLIALEAVAEERSFGRAALKLGYTQSAVSHQIAALERLVGERLVERPGGPLPVTLTEVGERFREHARAIVARVLAAYADVDALVQGGAGTVRVGTYQSSGARVLPRILRDYLGRFPAVTLHLTESSDGSELLELVEEGALDVTFALLPLPEGPFDSVPLLRDPWVLLVDSGSELVGRAEVPPAELARLPLIAWKSRQGAVEAQLRLHGYEPNVILRTDDSATIHGLVAAGIGVAIVPRLAVGPDGNGTVTIELGEAFSPRTVGLAWHRDRQLSAAAAGFLEIARSLTGTVGR